MEVGEFQRKRRERRERDQHLLAHRDDAKEWSIYADWLEREGDPRGTLVNLMLAREAGPTAALAEAEKAMLDPLPPWLVPGKALAGCWHSWWRGFLREVDMLARAKPSTDIGQLAQHPCALVLQNLAIAPTSEDRKKTLENTRMLPLRSLRIADAAGGDYVLSEPIDLGPLLTPSLQHLVLTCALDFLPTDFTRATGLHELTLTHARERDVERILKAPPPNLKALRVVSPVDANALVGTLCMLQRWSQLELFALHEDVVSLETAKTLASRDRPTRVVLQARHEADWEPAALLALRGSGVVTAPIERAEHRFMVWEGEEAGGPSATVVIAGHALHIQQLAAGAEPVRTRAALFDVSWSKKICGAVRVLDGRHGPRTAGTENIWSLVQSELDALLGFDPGPGIYSRLMQALSEAPR